MTAPITITHSTNGSSAPETSTFDFLVVACDPRLLPLSQRSALEQRVVSSLHSFTFRTSLYKAKRPEKPQLPAGGGGLFARRSDKPSYSVRFHPGQLDSMEGNVYGFRDEVMARDAEYRPSPNGVTWVSTYQIENKALLHRDQEEAMRALDGKRDAQVADPKNHWIDFKADESEKKQPEEALLADYFPHFDIKELEDHLPWKVKEAQGENNTLYVSSFTCFEAVLQLYLYQEMLMDGGVGKIDANFPKDKKARIAVIGAGPSGILFASQHLLKNGYDNFVIFEASDRLGGKTRTVRREAPAEPGKEVPCELGTCYLSLAYEPMFHLFDQYDAGEVVALDKDTNKFRAIIDPTVAKTEEERENGVEYSDWTLRKNGRIKLWERVEMYVAGIRYLVVHYATMGMTMNDCMPVEAPTELTVLENLERLIREVVDQSDDADEKEVPAQQLLGVLKDEKRSTKDRSQKSRGLFDLMDDFGQDMDDVQAMVSVDGLKKACRNVLNTPFGKFLDDNDMHELRSVFTYGYQVQGYGTLDIIPAYYGMIWMTPAVLTGNIRQLFNPSEAASQRGTVNVASKGWLTLWEKIVEKDLKDKIVYNTNITSVERVME